MIKEVEVDLKVNQTGDANKRLEDLIDKMGDVEAAERRIVSGGAGGAGAMPGDVVNRSSKIGVESKSIIFGAFDQAAKDIKMSMAKQYWEQRLVGESKKVRGEEEKLPGEKDKATESFLGPIGKVAVGMAALATAVNAAASAINVMNDATLNSADKMRLIGPSILKEIPIIGSAAARLFSAPSRIMDAIRGVPESMAGMQQRYQIESAGIQARQSGMLERQQLRSEAGMARNMHQVTRDPRFQYQLPGTGFDLGSTSGRMDYEENRIRVGSQNEIIRAQRRQEAAAMSLQQERDRHANLEAKRDEARSRFQRAEAEANRLGIRQRFGGGPEQRPGPPNQQAVMNLATQTANQLGLPFAGEIGAATAFASQTATFGAMGQVGGGSGNIEERMRAAIELQRSNNELIGQEAQLRESASRIGQRDIDLAREQSQVRQAQIRQTQALVELERSRISAMEQAQQRIGAMEEPEYEQALSITRYIQQHGLQSVSREMREQARGIDPDLIQRLEQERGAERITRRGRTGAAEAVGTRDTFAPFAGGATVEGRRQNLQRLEQQIQINVGMDEEKLASRIAAALNNTMLRLERVIARQATLMEQRVEGGVILQNLARAYQMLTGNTGS